MAVPPRNELVNVMSAEGDVQEIGVAIWQRVSRIGRER
jgi:hypothetical protein